jgi:hypothetical protein
MSRFEKGHTGRPLGSRNKLCRALLDDLAADWAEGGAAAIKIMRIEEPAQYVKAMVSILPRELLFENAASELDDDQLRDLIDRIREQLLIERQKQALELQPTKALTNGRH